MDYCSTGTVQTPATHIPVFNGYRVYQRTQSIDTDLYRAFGNLEIGVVDGFTRGRRLESSPAGNDVPGGKAYGTG